MFSELANPEHMDNYRYPFWVVELTLLLVAQQQASQDEPIGALEEGDDDAW
jgi:hypothetical protein